MRGRIDRREFLSIAGRYSLYSAMAFGFGCTVSKVVDDTRRVAIIYGSKYGATGDTAHWIREGIGKGAVAFDIDAISPSRIISNYDLFLIGSGIWMDGVHPRMIELLDENAMEMEKRIIASFIVCLTDPSTVQGRERITGYFEQFHDKLESQPVFNRAFGGRVVIDQLTPEDRIELVEFYRKYLNAELRDWDRTDPEGARGFGNEMNVSFINRPEQIKQS